ncbi:MAG: nucleoid-associated protein [Hahellaceae bacterium]|nr:nucleoid-associated protein [Hahellaceae bacterium]MCP5169015.1 nucleoid-associated protein [Hahellaceae bacterium]
MAIKSLIINKVSRWQDDQPATLTLRDTPLESNADYEALLSQEKKLFNAKPGKKYGRFSDEVADYPFSRWLSESLENKMSFTRCCEEFTGLFKQLLDASQVSTEGYLMFAEDTRADGDAFYIFWLENDSGMQLSRTLELDMCDYLNTSRLEIASRIELEDWRGEHPTDNYLTLLVSRNQSELGEVFSRCLGFQSSVDTEKETQTLLETLEQFASTVEPKSASQMYKKAYDFCAEQSARGEAVQIKELSGFLDEQEPARFANFVTQEKAMSESAEFFADHRKIKQLIRFAGKGKGLSLSFNSDLIQNAIHYDPDKDVLTITDIPKGLKQQLMRFIKSSDENA